MNTLRYLKVSRLFIFFVHLFKLQKDPDPYTKNNYYRSQTRKNGELSRTLFFSILSENQEICKFLKFLKSLHFRVAYH